WLDLPRRLVDRDLPRFSRAVFGRLREDARAPSGTNAIVLGLGNGAAREVLDVEPRLILVRRVAGDALCESRCGVATLNRVARGRLCEGRRRPDDDRQDDRPCASGEPRHPRTPHPFWIMTSWRLNRSCLVDCGPAEPNHVPTRRIRFTRYLGQLSHRRKVVSNFLLHIPESGVFHEHCRGAYEFS